MERRPPVADGVVILDVVVDERRLVEDLDRQGGRGPTRGGSRRRRRCRLPSEAGAPAGRPRTASKAASVDERPEELAAAGEKLARHCRGAAERRAFGREGVGCRHTEHAGHAEAGDEPLDLGRSEHAGCLAEERQVIANGGRGAARHAEQPQHPFHVDRGGGHRVDARLADGERVAHRLVRHRGDRQRRTPEAWRMPSADRRAGPLRAPRHTGR